jgi:hypothetical protein
LLQHRTLIGGRTHPLEHLDGYGSIQRKVMGAIDDAHPARADNVNHDVLADLLYQRIRTFIQTALGYLRSTLAGFQGGLCSSVPLLAGFTRFLAGILQGTIVTQATYTLPDHFSLVGKHLYRSAPRAAAVTTSVFPGYTSGAQDKTIQCRSN